MLLCAVAGTVEFERSRNKRNATKDQQRQITEIRNLVLFQMKEKKIDKAAIKRLLKEQNEKEETPKSP